MNDQQEMTSVKSSDSLCSEHDDDTSRTINEDDLIDSIPMIYEFTDEYLRFYVLEMHDPKFHTNLENDIIELVIAQWENTGICDGIEDDDEQMECLKEHTKMVCNDYFQLGISHAPPRSIYYTNPLATAQQPLINAHYSNVLRELALVHQPEQRTKEWYEFRHNLISASSLGKIFGTEASRNRLIYEKCQPLNENRFNGSCSVASPMHWGQKYEPLSTMLYEKIHNTKVSEFGCIQHKTYPFIGASPDGIVTKTDCPRYGRMLEIKNIVNRDITGIPLKDYWIQMQMQMECCNLDDCDFLETRFKEYEQEEEFWNDDSGKRRGIILYFVERVSIYDSGERESCDEKRPRSNTYPSLEKDVMDDGQQGYTLAQEYSGIPRYEYMPLDISLTKENVDMWIEETRAKLRRSWSLYTTIYWYLEEMSCVLVKRNKLWFEAALPRIRETWDTIEKERETGCSHRAPSKKLLIPNLQVVLNEENEKEISNFPSPQGGICLVKLGET